MTHAIALSVFIAAAAIFYSWQGSDSHPAAKNTMWVRAMLHCLAACSSLSPEAEKHLGELAEKGAGRKSAWRLPTTVCNDTKRRCDVLHDAFCAGLQCQVNASGSLGKWLPLRTALKAPAGTPEALARSEQYLSSHVECAKRCASPEYLTVSIGQDLSQAAVELAVARLTECGLVHVVGSKIVDETASAWKKAIDMLRTADPTSQNDLTKSDLRANRTEIFLPFDSSSPDPLAHGVVTAILAKYIDEPFVLDYVSLLNARAGIAGSQELHSDVPLFPRTSISVHTAVDEISLKMGPTLFCPCTHSVTGWEEALDGEAIGEAVRFTTAFRSALRATSSVVPAMNCLGEAYVPKKLPAGLVTIYDGSVLHAGLANTASIDRMVFNMNFAAPPGYEDARNYTARDPKRAVDEVVRWRSHVNGAGRSHAERFTALQRWVQELPSS